jgi:hypothetical protein
MGAGAREPEARGPRRGGRRRTPVASRLLVTRALDKDESEAVGADDEARRRHTAVTAGQRNRALVKRAGPVHDLRDRAVGRSTFIIGFGAPLYQMQGVPIQKRNQKVGSSLVPRFSKKPNSTNSSAFAMAAILSVPHKSAKLSDVCSVF